MKDLFWKKNQKIFKDRNQGSSKIRLDKESRLSGELKGPAFTYRE
jgi:hypothetical protein